MQVGQQFLCFPLDYLDARHRPRGYQSVFPVCCLFSAIRCCYLSSLHERLIGVSDKQRTVVGILAWAVQRDRLKDRRISGLPVSQHLSFHVFVAIVRTFSDAMPVGFFRPV